MNKIIYLLLSIFLFSSCSNDDSKGINDEGAIDMISGIVLKNSFGINVGQLGNPNVKIDYDELQIFPNPATDVLGINNMFNNPISDIWLVKCNPSKNFKNIDFELLLDNDMYSVEEIESNSVQNFNGITGTSLLINLENLEEGYYKVFVSTNNNIYWDNIYINKNGIDINTLDGFWQ